MLDDILNAITAAIQADTLLPEPIITFHKVEGMIPGLETTCSVWVPKQNFKPYTNDDDEVDAKIHIGIGLQDMDPENGEARIRALAEEIRLLLTADTPRLGGLLDDSFLSEWEFATVNASQTEVLHLGEAVWEVTYYGPRTRSITPSEPMEELDFTEIMTIGG
ncbi:hypothetical protein DEAC_c17050 [Desulfosporosinus acididurans]|uniref:Gp37 protein n=1 Tax=Desulfosporosinus acididurans TaxID=476652 RepID=A0A0J1INQ6_9FIRM|nr:hypothetical protein [Desulfosporosinus acididurans]KLU66306.1 hypothetical protein DEAC_c17050 [Desulfosporosinus acididurans]